MNFWELPLHMLNQQQWEALCDGCGQCCMHKFEDVDTGEVLRTTVACKLFDTQACQCKDYSNRLRCVSDCLCVKNLDAEHYHWLPETCAYRLRKENKALFDWHPLISGNSDSVHDAGISMRHRCTSELEVAEDMWFEYVQE